ncbi:MAG: hypothetical protein ABIP80_06535 [Ferruginibacter sp.]
MAHEHPNRDNEKKPKDDTPIKPEPETLHKTDPQEHMEGPISSLMHKTGKTLDTHESKEKADKEKDENM